MADKYIIELKDGETLYKAVIGADGEPYITPAMCYVSYNLEAIRKKAYEKGVQDTKQHWVDAPRTCAYKLGYENGLNDAWETLGKIFLPVAQEGLPASAIIQIFGNKPAEYILKDYSASEAIEKIRAYEQEKEEIRVGDEVAFHHDDGRPDTVVVVTHIGQDGFIDGMDGRGTQYAHKNPKKWTKTGRDFPELAEVLRKMRENSDG